MKKTTWHTYQMNKHTDSATRSIYGWINPELKQER